MHRDLYCSYKMHMSMFGMNEGFQKGELSRKTLQHLFRFVNIFLLKHGLIGIQDLRMRRWDVGP